MLCLWPIVPNKEEIFLIWHIVSPLSIRNGLSEVCRSLWLFEPRKGYGAAQSSTSMELWLLMDLNLYALDIIRNHLYEKVYFYKHDKMFGISYGSCKLFLMFWAFYF